MQFQTDANHAFVIEAVPAEQVGLARGQRQQLVRRRGAAALRSRARGRQRRHARLLRRGRRAQRRPHRVQLARAARPDNRLEAPWPSLPAAQRAPCREPLRT